MQNELARTYARVLNKALEGKPDDLTIGLRLPRQLPLNTDFRRRL